MITAVEEGTGDCDVVQSCLSSAGLSCGRIAPFIRDKSALLERTAIRIAIAAPHARQSALYGNVLDTCACFATHRDSVRWPSLHFATLRAE